MRSVITVILIIVILAVGVQLYRLFRQNLDLKSELSKVGSELDDIVEDNTVLRADLEYFADYDNLAKELRGKLNYKLPGEKLIIIVPPKD